MADLISIAQARQEVLAQVRPLSTEPVRLDEAYGRFLAEEVRSEVHVPPFDSSAMDGFALIAGPAAELVVTGESRAGHPSAVAVEPGTAVRISTGAQIPEGADAVVPIERVTEADHHVQVPDTEPGANLRRAGEDVRPSDLVMAGGRVLGPAEVGVLASLGRSEVLCGTRPRVALLVTGDELTPPGEPLAPGHIWSSNGHVLTGQIAAAGGTLVLRETVEDSAASTRAALERALAEADLVCVSGGVSVGPHDHVKATLRELGVEERFWGVRLKPGKPTWFGTRTDGEDRRLVFGLPGNPVSAMVTFQLFARAAIAAMQGGDPSVLRATAVLDAPVPLSPAREQAVRCHLRAAEDGWHAVPTGDQGSHRLTSMLDAAALALVPAGQGELPAGERVDVELLDLGKVAA